MKYIINIIKSILILIVLLILYPYLICPIYKFPEYKIFTGNKLYNPYNQNNNYKWYKINLHAHTNAWYGITNGENISDSVISKYKHLNFDIIGISDYMKINKFLSNNKHYIPVYEHGYGFNKVHQLSINAKKVVWYDFILFFNTHQKQFIINQVKENSDIVALNHPRHKNAYSPQDLKKLANYDCFEALNRSWFSIALWDSILSAGHYVPLIANDDCHDISVFDVGTNYTLVNAKSDKREDIISALKKGSTIGIDICMSNNETFKTKLLKINALPHIKKIVTSNNSITIITDTIISEFKFIGQNGKVKKIINNTDSATYELIDDDTYIRTEITASSGSKLYLNPVYKYNKNIPVELNSEVDIYKTIMYRIALFVLFGIIIFFVFRKKFRK